MSGEKVDEFWNARPFHPFTIHTADGSAVRVRSPEMMWRNPRGRTVYVAAGRGDETHHIDLIMITKIVTGGGGRRGRNGNGRH